MFSAHKISNYFTSYNNNKRFKRGKKRVHTGDVDFSVENVVYFIEISMKDLNYACEAASNRPFIHSFQWKVKEISWKTLCVKFYLIVIKDSVNRIKFTPVKWIMTAKIDIIGSFIKIKDEEKLWRGSFIVIFKAKWFFFCIHKNTGAAAPTAQAISTNYNNEASLKLDFFSNSL